jgi:hypothetical protein
MHRFDEIVMAGLVPATPIIWHGRASLSGSPGQARHDGMTAATNLSTDAKT